MLKWKMCKCESWKRGFLHAQRTMQVLLFSCIYSERSGLCGFGICAGNRSLGHDCSSSDDCIAYTFCNRLTKTCAASLSDVSKN